jgi:hypothetical protein
MYKKSEAKGTVHIIGRSAEICGVPLKDIKGRGRWRVCGCARNALKRASKSELGQPVKLVTEQMLLAAELSSLGT